MNTVEKLVDIDKKINNKIVELIKWASYRDCDWNLYDAVLKGDEEFGELAESVLVSTGRIKHKTLTEKSTGEIADNINQLVDVVSYKPDFLANLGFLIINQGSFNSHIRSSFKKYEDGNYKEIVIKKLLSFKKYKDFFNDKDALSDILRFEDCTKYLAEINYILYLIENNISKEEANDESVLASLEELYDKLEKNLINGKIYPPIFNKVLNLRYTDQYLQNVEGLLLI